MLELQFLFIVIINIRDFFFFGISSNKAQHHESGAITSGHEQEE